MVPWAPTLLDSELTELPGETLAVGTYGLGGCRCRFWNVVEAFVQGMHRGIKSPKCWVLLACGTASSSPLVGYSEGVLLTEHAGTKALEL